MRKKLIVLGLSLALCLTGLTACGGSDDAASNTEATTEAAEAEAVVTEEETTEAAPANKELTYDTPGYTVKVTVPEDSGFDFTTDFPENLNGAIGSLFLDGGNFFASIGTKGYLSGETWDSSVKIWKDNNDDAVETTFAGRDAIRFDYRMGSGEGELYGYEYYAKCDDIIDTSCLVITILVSDGNPASTDAVFSDEETQAILDSFVFEKN